MQAIDIQINQAKIGGFAVTFQNEKTPIVRATIELYSGTKKISEFSIATSNWHGDVKFDLPVDIIEPILAISRELEQIVVRECRTALQQIGMEHNARDGD